MKIVEFDLTCEFTYEMLRQELDKGNFVAQDSRIEMRRFIEFIRRQPHLDLGYYVSRYMDLVKIPDLICCALRDEIRSGEFDILKRLENLPKHYYSIEMVSAIIDAFKNPKYPLVAVEQLLDLIDFRTEIRNYDQRRHGYDLMSTYTSRSPLIFHVLQYCRNVDSPAIRRLIAKGDFLSLRMDYKMLPLQTLRIIAEIHPIMSSGHVEFSRIYREKIAAHYRSVIDKDLEELNRIIRSEAVKLVEISEVEFKNYINRIREVAISRGTNKEPEPLSQV